MASWWWHNASDRSISEVGASSFTSSPTPPRLLKNPSTCVPCGHTFCGGCLTASGGKCQECDEPPDGLQQTLKVAQLETLVAKFGFQKQALAALCTTNATAVA